MARSLQTQVTAGIGRPGPRSLGRAGTPWGSRGCEVCEREGDGANTAETKQEQSSSFMLSPTVTDSYRDAREMLRGLELGAFSNPPGSGRLRPSRFIAVLGPHRTLTGRPSSCATLACRRSAPRLQPALAARTIPQRAVDLCMATARHGCHAIGRLVHAFARLGRVRSQIATWQNR